MGGGIPPLRAGVLWLHVDGLLLSALAKYGSIGVDLFL